MLYIDCENPRLTPHQCQPSCSHCPRAQTCEPANQCLATRNEYFAGLLSRKSKHNLITTHLSIQNMHVIMFGRLLMPKQILAKSDCPYLPSLAHFLAHSYLSYLFLSFSMFLYLFLSSLAISFIFFIFCYLFGGCVNIKKLKDISSGISLLHDRSSAFLRARKYLDIKKEMG